MSRLSALSLPLGVDVSDPVDTTIANLWSHAKVRTPMFIMNPSPSCNSLMPQSTRTLQHTVAQTDRSSTQADENGDLLDSVKRALDELDRVSDCLLSIVPDVSIPPRCRVQDDATPEWTLGKLSIFG